MRIRTPSRIHITLIDLNASIGRMDGGIGLAIEEPYIEISAKLSSTVSVKGPYRERALVAAEKIIKKLGIKGGASIKIEKAYEPHIGLGSGTQLMLGVGRLIADLYKTDISSRGIAEIMGRGGTSGIGTAAFERGGFILDGGHSTKDKQDFLPSSYSKADPPPILARYDFPDWRIALVIPEGLEVHGEKEINIFKTHCPIPIGEVRKLSHLILMKMLPALVEEDISTFGSSINKIQKIGFKKIELGLQNPKVRDLLKRVQRNSYGAGLSSFGPAIYCIVSDEEKLLKKVGRDARVIFTRANNSGAKRGK